MSLVAPHWTTRLKRYGGLAEITRMRQRQELVLNKAIEKAFVEKDKEQADALRELATWLDGNPLRVLPVDLEESLSEEEEDFV